MTATTSRSDFATTERTTTSNEQTGLAGFVELSDGRRFVCGPRSAANVDRPSSAHYQAHRNHSDGIACGAALAEVAAYANRWKRQKRGLDPDGYTPSGPPGVWTRGCSDNPDDAKEPGAAHYQAHRNLFEIPCAAAVRSLAWYHANLRNRKDGLPPVTDFKPDLSDVWLRPTACYVHLFINGFRYYGISVNPSFRWKEQSRRDKPIGFALRNIDHESRVLLWLPNRYAALEEERRLIIGWAERGGLYNRIHNPNRQAAKNVIKELIDALA